MDLNKKKRTLPKSSTNQLSKKRRKLQQAASGGKAKKRVDVNSLQWRTVDVPEMFDDAEGFFGLEEIDGVDIIRDGDTVQFVCHKITALFPTATNP